MNLANGQLVLFEAEVAHRVFSIGSDSGRPLPEGRYTLTRLFRWISGSQAPGWRFAAEIEVVDPSEEPARDHARVSSEADAVGRVQRPHAGNECAPRGDARPGRHQLQRVLDARNRVRAAALRSRR